MDSFELNKIMGAVLGTLLFAMGLSIFSQVIYTPKKPAVPGYDLPVPEPVQPAAAGDQGAQAEPLPVRLASADAKRGEGAAKKCQACHVFEKGGPNKIGPALYGVVGRPKGSHEGFAYSAAMKEKGGEWSFDELDHFIANPKGYVKGTIMAFAGISSPKERADVIRYLQSLSDNPVPLPPAQAAAATPAQTAPAGSPAPGSPTAPRPGSPATAPTGSPSQATQQPSPSLPGQKVDPAPAALQANPQPATNQPQPAAKDQPTPTQIPATQPQGGGADQPK
ncbi:MAG: c-type cytochrome [Methylobacteriaceae bacterium]|nr:c-type cytochrome [Methylobacteriaceae bacterium]